MTDIKTTSGTDAVPAGPSGGAPATGAAAPPGSPPGTPSAAAAAPLPVRRRGEWLVFVLRNKKVIGGGGVVLAFLLFGLLSPLFLEHGPRDRFIPQERRAEAPSTDFWLGTTRFGEDVFTQLAYGVRSTFLVAVLAALIAAIIGMTVGFLAGYRGGFVDELLMMVTNVVLVLPVFIILVVVSSYANEIPAFDFNRLTQAVVIGLFSWPWVARAVRAQTLSLRSRDFVDLARLTGVGTLSIVRKEIAPNMGSYLVMVFVLLFAGAILFAAALDFLGLGPSGGMSLGLMLNFSREWSALHLGHWWWFIPPGVAITAITGAAYITNVGLDEVFNPKLREM
ncbi:MAG TPA: ABC transporter permease [Natronosporangium sp.]|nr:ABC transporter permease [Natronosporangium sp.]